MSGVRVGQRWVAPYHICKQEGIGSGSVFTVWRTSTDRVIVKHQPRNAAPVVRSVALGSFLSRWTKER